MPAVGIPTGKTIDAQMMNIAILTNVDALKYNILSILFRII